jgi:hypothetical protein
MAIDYKQKFLDIKSKFISSVDTAYRVGYQQGQKDAQLESMQQQMQMQQQQMQQMQQAQASMMGGGPEMGGGGEDQQPSPFEQADQFEQAQGQEQMDRGVSELEAGIEELRSLLGKSEIDKQAASSLIEKLNKSIGNILQVRESQELKKNMDSIKQIGKTFKKVENLSLSFKANTTKDQKKALSMQKAIVDDIMAKWEKEEKEAEKDILNVLKPK